MLVNQSQEINDECQRRRGKHLRTNQDNWGGGRGRTSVGCLERGWGLFLISSMWGYGSFLGQPNLVFNEQLRQPKTLVHQSFFTIIGYIDWLFHTLGTVHHLRCQINLHMLLTLKSFQQTFCHHMQ